EQTLIVKIKPSGVHELVSRGFSVELWAKVIRMGLRQALNLVGGTTFQGIQSWKEADCAYKPNTFRPYENDWPTLVIECGVSESLNRLRVESRWWLENSVEGVNIVLLFSISKKARSIHIEKWEMATHSSPHVAQAGLSHLIGTPTKIQEVDISGPVVPTDESAGTTPIVTGAPLELDFTKIFLRQPVQGCSEGSIIFTEQEL
ncbi:unnamed protein product, partial [Tuber aestivum]